MSFEVSCPSARTNPRQRRRLLGAPLLVLLLAGSAAANPPPWERTEMRQPCGDFNTFRNPYFGETHVHTTYSFDAVSGGINHDPRNAYEFATGQSLALPVGTAGSRIVQLRRPLDFTAVTDHAEFFGEVQICLDPGLPGYGSTECTNFRDSIPQLDQESSPGITLFGATYLTTLTPSRFGFCGVGNTDCLSQASLVWQDTQDAAEQFYDRTSACTFTTFVAYEHTGNPGVRNNHRNVIFRNESVPALPISFMEQPTPQGLWGALQVQCLDAGSGCDVLAIPHNSNLSNGIMFLPENADGSPLSAADATFRAAMEPIVEVMQHKGDSECHPFLSPGDELCGFEKWSYDFIGLPPGLFGPFVPEATGFVRTALMEGLVQEQQIGANPFQFGLIGATDSHNATPGLTNEEDYVTAGHLGTRDATPLLQTHPLGLGVVGGIEANGGGLAVVWAEENSRDALFAAMRRREVYGTSGTRPIVRFFAGRLPKGLCGRSDFVEKGYEGGVPMGGEIGPVRSGGSPRFAVMALKDPGTMGAPGTPLQRVQIIKGWVDAGGTSHEKVFEVAGDPSNSASVDESTCATSGPGFGELCEVWSDPEFDRSQRAFYYARVVENPVCRWSTRLCNSQGIDCDVPASIPAGLEECCNAARPKTIQERAWTSPIFYRPEGIARLHGRVRFGASAGTDTFTLKAKIGDVSPEFDLNSNGLTVDVRDDDVIYHVTIPAGSWQQSGNHFRYKDPTGSLNGLKRATVTFTKHGTIRLRLATIPMDLSNADETDHMVQTSIEIGSYKATHNRYWETRGQRLVEVRR